MKGLFKIFTILAGAILLQACADNKAKDIVFKPDINQPYTIRDQQLQGVVDGKAWNWVSGHLIEDEDFEGNKILRVELYAEDILLCSQTAWFRAINPVVIATVTDLNKTYVGFQPSLNILTRDGSSSTTLLPNEVSLELTGVQGGFLIGGLGVRMEAQAEISGRFFIKDCRSTIP